MPNHLQHYFQEIGHPLLTSSGTCVHIRTLRHTHINYYINKWMNLHLFYCAYFCSRRYCDRSTCVTIVSVHLAILIFLHLSFLYWKSPSISLLPVHKIYNKLLLTMFSPGSHRTLALISPACISVLVIWPPSLQPDPFACWLWVATVLHSMSTDSSGFSFCTHFLSRVPDLTKSSYLCIFDKLKWHSVWGVKGELTKGLV